MPRSTNRFRNVEGARMMAGLPSSRLGEPRLGRARQRRRKATTSH